MLLHEWTKALIETHHLHAVAMNYVVLTILYIALTALCNRSDRIYTDPPYRALTGLLFGFFACAAMAVPAFIAEGVITDSRLAIISFAGIFFGPVAALLATIPPVILRLFLGGDGMATGIASMLVVMMGGGGLGYYIYKYNRGFVHLRGIMIYTCVIFPACAVTAILLPDTIAPKIFIDGGTYIILINVVGAWLLGYMLCQDQSRRLMIYDIIHLHEETEKAVAGKTLFMARMSHELRTPINAIIGFGDLLRATPLSDEQRYYLDQLKIAGRTMTALVSDILDFSKIGSGKIALDIDSFNLVKLVESCGTLITPEAMKKNLAVTVLIDPLCPEWVRGDDLRIRQILMNLLGNAVKFTNQGSVTLRCAVSSHHGGQYEIAFFVEDTGIGIAHDKRRSIFKAFEQVDSSITRERGGAGLGLSIACELVKMMGGQIDLTSTPGIGSTFLVHLSLPATTPVILPTAPRETPISNSARKILLVEDIAMNQEMARNMLGKLGYHCDVAGNGVEALQKLDDSLYDLVLMDLQMPLLNGYDTATQIRNQRGIDSETMPVIALTAHALPEEIAKCFESGMDDFMTKPIEFIELAAKMDEWLGDGSSDSWNALPRQDASYENAPLIAEAELKTFLNFVGEERLHEAYNDFCDDWEILITAIKNNTEGEKTARGTLHNITAISGNLGMKKLSLYAQQLLNQAAAHAPEPAETDVIDSIFRESCRAFERYLAA